MHRIADNQQNVIPVNIFCQGIRDFSLAEILICTIVTYIRLFWGVS